MARKSRVNITTENKSQKIYKVGVYVRISRFNNNFNDNDTIENQKNIIFDFILKNDEFNLIKVYEDKNMTGTNFNRAGFENLLDDIKAGVINCIIVKDLSRFGRDYKECSNYLENILPFFNTRFIAINDNYDSINIGSNDILLMQLKNIVNETYAKDISKKVSSTIKQKKENGQYLCTTPPYGYLKDKENKGKVIIDESVRQVIVDIFKWRLENENCKSIALKLQKLNITPPFKHFLELGVLKTNRYNNSIWTSATIRKILNNDFYIGTLSQGKSKQTVLGVKKKISTPKEDWIVIENNHTPIIDKETFYKVQEINKMITEKYHTNYNKNEYLKEENILKGIIKCGCCGKNITKIMDVKENKTKEPSVRKYFICRTKNKYHKDCTFKNIREEIVLNAVFNHIKLQIKIAEDLKNIIESEDYKNEIKQKKIVLENKINVLNNELKKITNYYEVIYNDLLDNILTEEGYIYVKNKYKKKEKEINTNIKSLKKEIKNLEKQSSYNKFVSNFLLFKNQEILSKEMVKNLIENITVYDDKTIKIKFNFYKDYNILKEDFYKEVLI